MLYSLKVQGLRIRYFLADVLVYLMTILLIAYIRYSDDITVININAYYVTLMVLGVIYLGLLYLSGNYEPDVLLYLKWRIYLRAVIYTSAIFFVTSFYIRSVSFSRVYFTALFMVNFLVAVILRMALNRFHRKMYCDELKYPMVAVGFEKCEPDMLGKTADVLGLKVIAEFESKYAISELVQLQERLVLTRDSMNKGDIGVLLYEEGDGEFQELVSFCEINYIPLYILPSASRMLSVPLRALDHKGLLIFGPKDLLVDGVSKRLKRTIDVILAIIGIVFTSWLMLLIWLFIKVTSNGPGFFEQERLGLDGKIIKIYKFRTMVIDSEKVLNELLEDDEIRKSYYEAYKLENDPRVTKIGQYLRRLSLDELPQLWNILRGDISFVGPRPIIPPELDRYGTHGNLVLRVKPGLTGLWQVNGRNDVSYEERINLDLYYIHNWSMGLDIKIIFQTVPSVVFGRGAC